MPTVLITGANRGLGLEFARQYAAHGLGRPRLLPRPGRGAASWPRSAGPRSTPSTCATSTPSPRWPAP